MERPIENGKKKEKGYCTPHICNFSPQARSLTGFPQHKKCANHNRRYIYSPQVKMGGEKKGRVIVGPSENGKKGVSENGR